MDSPPSVRSATPTVTHLCAPREEWQFEWWLRLVMVAAGLALVSLLVTARMLEPNSKGFGTHRQLGLPPCDFLSTFGARCPACGMTTSWSHLTRGNLVGSLSVNAGGTLLGLVALITGPWLLFSGLKGRWIGRPPQDWVVIGTSVVLTLVIAVDWIVRVYFA